MGLTEMACSVVVHLLCYSLVTFMLHDKALEEVSLEKEAGLTHGFRESHSIISELSCLVKDIMASGVYGRRQMFASLQQEGREKNARFL